MGATSGPGAVVSRVNALPPSGIGRHRPAKQNQSSPAFVNFHFDFGDLVPVNSKKCDAGMRHRPTGNLRPSERKLMIGAPLGRAGGKPHRNSAKSFVPSSNCRITGALSVGQMSSRVEIRRSLRPSHRNACLAKRCEVVAVWDVVSEVVAHAEFRSGPYILLMLGERLIR